MIEGSCGFSVGRVTTLGCATPSTALPQCPEFRWSSSVVETRMRCWNRRRSQRNTVWDAMWHRPQLTAFSVGCTKVSCSPGTNRRSTSTALIRGTGQTHRPWSEADAWGHQICGEAPDRPPCVGSAAQSRISRTDRSLRRVPCRVPRHARRHRVCCGRSGFGVGLPVAAWVR